jgi:hypothetical protein
MNKVTIRDVLVNSPLPQGSFTNLPMKIHRVKEGENINALTPADF